MACFGSMTRETCAKNGARLDAHDSRGFQQLLRVVTRCPSRLDLAATVLGDRVDPGTASEQLRPIDLRPAATTMAGVSLRLEQGVRELDRKGVLPLAES
jgi:hypothetical protein